MADIHTGIHTSIHPGSPGRQVAVARQMHAHTYRQTDRQTEIQAANTS